MWLTNSSSQIASTPQVCLRVMADVTPGQILNKGCSSQLVSIMLEGVSRGQPGITWLTAPTNTCIKRCIVSFLY